MGRLAAGVVMALLLVAWLATGVGAQQAPGAPTISTVTAGDGQLAVTWTAPTNNGGSAVTSYDLRYITTSADETIDSNWTVKNGVWAYGQPCVHPQGAAGRDRIRCAAACREHCRQGLLVGHSRGHADYGHADHRLSAHGRLCAYRRLERACRG